MIQIHSSFLKMADNKKRKRLTAYEPLWEKDFPIGPASQNIIVTHVKKLFLVDTWVEGMLLDTVILKQIQFIT